MCFTGHNAMSGDIQQEYDEFIKTLIWPALRAAGLTRKGDTFYLNSAGNWGVINFQKSTSNTADEVKFTVNLGVASARILRFLDGLSPADATPRFTVNFTSSAV